MPQCIGDGVACDNAVHTASMVLVLAMVLAMNLMVKQGEQRLQF